jgi:hypothetical protein
MSVKNGTSAISMDAGAAANAGSGASASHNGDGPAHPSDPLQRLEAELSATGKQRSTDRGRPDGAELYEEAQRLLEEAWGIFTECQVMRDGLLTACVEIERTMDSIQLRIGGLPGAIESNGNGQPANGKVAMVSNSNGAGHSSNGAGHGSNGAGHNSNGTSSGSNGAGPH